MNSISEYDDSDDWARIGFFLSTGGMQALYHSFYTEGISVSTRTLHRP